MQAVFNEQAGHESYNAHLKHLQEWNKGKTIVISKICNKLFEHALWVFYTVHWAMVIADGIFSGSTGTKSLETMSHVSEEAKAHAQEELVGHTGDTDSEGDDE